MKSPAVEPSGTYTLCITATADAGEVSDAVEVNFHDFVREDNKIAWSYVGVSAVVVMAGRFSTDCLACFRQFRLRNCGYISFHEKRKYREKPLF